MSSRSSHPRNVVFIMAKGQTWLGFDGIAANTEVIRQFRAQCHGSIKRIHDQIARIVDSLDQCRADVLGCDGHPFIRTPNLDRLARSGVLFVSAFCQNPVREPQLLPLPGPTPGRS